jgi:hypothetical protein
MAPAAIQARPGDRRKQGHRQREAAAAASAVRVAHLRGQLLEDGPDLADVGRPNGQLDRKAGAAERFAPNHADAPALRAERILQMMRNAR